MQAGTSWGHKNRWGQAGHHKAALQPASLSSQRQPHSNLLLFEAVEMDCTVVLDWL